MLGTAVLKSIMGRLGSKSLFAFKFLAMLEIAALVAAFYVGFNNDKAHYNYNFKKPINQKVIKL